VSEATSDSSATPIPRPASEGPVQPSDAERKEIQTFLQADQSRLGDVYRALDRALAPDQIASELKVGTPGFVSNNRRSIKALTKGELPTAPTVALATAQKFRMVLKSKGISTETRLCLEANLTWLERRANDATARAIEVRRAQEQTEEAESRNVAGIYVYSLPHYLRYPYDPISGLTLMKVGRSDSSVMVRFREQTRTTALPEEPLLLRIYRADLSRAAQIEKEFHALLKGGGHGREVCRSAGQEWFVTSTAHLDAMARAWRLPIDVVTETDLPDEA
jgi:T5orf172 domain